MKRRNPINTIENIKAYAYVNIDNPMVAWETAIGRMVSVNESNLDLSISMRSYALIEEYSKGGLSERITNELRLELIRKQSFPSQVSRLNGIFLFTDKELVKDAFERWRIPINEDYITQVNFSASKISRLDSEWITFNLGNSSKDIDWAHSYWSGETHGEKPLTEIIANGIGLIVSPELRSEAYLRTKKLVPQLSKGLALSAYAFNSGHEYVGQVMPHIYQENDDTLMCAYIADFREFTEHSNTIDFEKCIEICSKKGYQFPYDAKADENKDIVIPAEFKSHNFKLEGEQFMELYKSILNKN